MPLTADEIATWRPSDPEFEHWASVMFSASITQHLVALDPASLEELADNGILLVDEARTIARDFSCDAVHVLAHPDAITGRDKGRWNMPFVTAYFKFTGLKDFFLIQRHVLRLPRDGRTWHDLSHAERLRVAIAYVNLLTPLQSYMEQIHQRSRSERRHPNRLRFHTSRRRF
jgi:hypothetical protein